MSEDKKIYGFHHKYCYGEKEKIKKYINKEDTEHSEDSEDDYWEHFDIKVGFNKEVPTAHADDDKNWKEGNEKWVSDGINWVREGKYEKEKNVTKRYKDFVIKEMGGRTRRFIICYDQSIIDNIYHNHERSIELITLPLKHRMNNYYKDLFKEEVNEYFLNDEKEDFLTLTPEKAKEKINKIMLSYKDKVRKDVKEKLNEGNLFFF